MFGIHQYLLIMTKLLIFVPKTDRKRVQSRRRMRTMRYIRKFRKSLESEMTISQQQSIIYNETGNKTNICLNSQMRLWVSKYHISRCAVDELLTILRSFGLDQLPKSCKMLMQTPNKVSITEVAGGRLWYNGIENEIRCALKNIEEDKILQLNFNIDGLPIFRSSATSFWPILAHIQSEFILN